MKNLKKFLRWPRKPAPPAEPERASLPREFLGVFRKRAMIALAVFLIAIISSSLTLLFVAMGGDEILRKWNMWQEEVKTTHTVRFSGQFLLLKEGQAEPVPFAAVAVKALDGEGSLTDQNGYFEMDVKLPLERKHVILRFLDEHNPPLGKDPSSFVREVVLQDGQFFRPINEFGGEDIHIWVYKEGYPVFNVSRVLNPNQKNIDFGNIYIPKTLKAGAIAGGGAAKPIQAYSDMCLKDRAGQFAPADIRCILDYTVQDEAGSRCGQPYQKVYGAEFLFKSPQSVSSGVRLDRIFLFFGQ